jgi:diguanylate cyclase (GGDEF)-like protein
MQSQDRYLEGAYSLTAHSPEAILQTVLDVVGAKAAALYWIESPAAAPLLMEAQGFIQTPVDIPVRFPQPAAEERYPFARRVADLADLGDKFADLAQQEGLTCAALGLSGEAGKPGCALLVLRGAAQPFSEEELSFLKAAATQAYLALLLARLQTDLELQRRNDPLTGLYNRRYFLEMVSREFERSQRTGTTVSLLMVDVHHFKQVNDLCGHLRGDQILVMVAQRLKSALRSVDFIARYGGDEFIILLVACDESEAPMVARRIAQHVGTIPVEDDQGIVQCQLVMDYSTVTLDLINDVSIDSLLARAEAEMQRQKAYAA